MSSDVVEILLPSTTRVVDSWAKSRRHSSFTSLFVDSDVSVTEILPLDIHTTDEYRHHLLFMSRPPVEVDVQCERLDHIVMI
jgi:hypothetical protein